MFIIRKKISFKGMVIKMAASRDCSFEQNQLISFLICPLCVQIFNQPIRLHRCGHTFCQKCCPPLLDKCPSCCTLVEVKQPDIIANNLIADLIVRCNGKDCPFRGSYEYYKSSHKYICPMRKSGGIQAWMEGMRGTINSFEPAKQEKRAEVSAEVIQVENIDQKDIDIQKDENVNFDCRIVPKILLFPSKKIQKPKQTQKFIECIQIPDESSKFNRNFISKNIYPLTMQQKLKRMQNRTNPFQID